MKRALAVLLLTAAPAAHADQVLLRGGGAVSGEIVAQTDAGLVIDVGPGRMTLPMSRVLRIVASTSDLAVYRQRASGLAAGDVAGWLYLARWAESRDLATQARHAWERVLALEPGNPAANAALGNVRLEGRWVSREDAYRAQGLVAFEGQWISPAERAAILAERSADARGRELAAEAEARAREAEARARVAEADARRAEAQAAETADGIPYPFVYGGGIYGPVVGPVHGVHSHGRPHAVRGRRGHHGHRDRDLAPPPYRLPPTRDEGASSPPRRTRNRR